MNLDEANERADVSAHEGSVLIDATCQQLLNRRHFLFEESGSTFMSDKRDLIELISKSDGDNRPRLFPQRHLD